MPDTLQLSIIIPVLNEAQCLEQSLDRLFAQAFVSENCEIILCDGGSNDDSLQIAARYPCRIEHSEAGRALQMNCGANAARADLLLFLHADTDLPEDFQISDLSGAQWGFFRLRLKNDAAIYRVIEFAVNLRSRMTSVAGGDQALFFSRDMFRRLDSFPAIPLMEDVAICKAARRLERPRIIESVVNSSSRRWQTNGVIRTILLMWSLRLAYWLGISPARLYRIYYPERAPRT